jgi:carbon-monoxide dehydrogenase large subunit
VADLHSEGQLHCVFVRSPHAHAAIEKIDATQALMQPGVVAVLTGADMAADRVGPMTCLWAIRSHDGSAMAEPPRWALARERVRHVGEPIAVIIAETSEQALAAAEAVSVEYAALPAVVDARAAMEAPAPQLHEAAPQNVCFRWSRATSSQSSNNCARRAT